MADRGYVLSEIAGIQDDTTKRILRRVFEHVLDLQTMGVPGHQQKARNFAQYYVEGTTSTTADEEFSIVHGIGRSPYLAVQVLPLQTIGAAAVRLQVTRAADTQRVYLSSPEVGAVVTLLLEA